jgi:Domain of unknown function (DUF1877)
MSCLGVLFSLDEQEVNKLKSFNSDEDRLEYLQEEIEEIYFDKFPDRMAELDKSWDAIHRSLTDGKLEYKNGSFPLNHVIMGGEIIYFEEDYIMSVKTPEQVKQIAAEIDKIGEQFLKTGYYKIDANDYGFPLAEDDFEYTWSWLDGSKEFWKLAAAENRFVLFTADQ